MEDLYEYGTLASIKQTARLQKGNLRITAEGLYRVKLGRIISDTDYIISEVYTDECNEKPDLYDALAKEAMMRVVIEQFAVLARSDKRLSLELDTLSAITDLDGLLIKISADIPCD